MNLERLGRGRHVFYFENGTRVVGQLRIMVWHFACTVSLKARQTRVAETGIAA